MAVDGCYRVPEVLALAVKEMQQRLGEVERWKKCSSSATLTVQHQ